jgi:hypothetical protein
MKNAIVTLLTLLSMTAFVCLIIGFFNPRKALFWYRRPRTKKASAWINGCIFVGSLVICGLLTPPSPDADKLGSNEPGAEQPANATSASQPDTKTGDPQSAAEKAPQAEETVRYEIADSSTEGDAMYLKLTINTIYDRPALIEATRKLREQCRAKGIFSCYYYYRKYTRMMTATAGVIYLNDCSQCEYKDKDGTPVDFPCYNLRKSAADSLRALTFDTAGFKPEVVFLDPIGNMRKYILAAPSGKALLVEQSLDGHEITTLVKIRTAGQDRFCETEDKHKYYLIDKDSGLVDHYSYGELDNQDAIDQ